MLVNYGFSKPLIFDYLLTNQLAKCLHWLTNISDRFVNYLQTNCEPLAKDFLYLQTTCKGFWATCKGICFTSKPLDKNIHRYCKTNQTNFQSVFQSMSQICPRTRHKASKGPRWKI